MADKNKAKSVKAERRRKRVRGKIRGTTQRPRLTVAKSLRNILVQIVDDENGKTLIGLSSNSKLMQGVVLKKDTKTQMAHKVGLKVAELGKEKGIESVVFDRNRFQFHGRVKAVAAGASEGGLKI